MKLEYNKIQADQFKRDLSKERLIYDELIESVKPYKGKIDSEFLPKYKAYLLKTGRENKAFDTIPDDKLLNLLSLDDQYFRVKNLYNEVQYLDLHKSDENLDAYLDEKFSTYTYDPFEIKVAQGILDSAKFMEEIGTPKGVIDQAFQLFGYRHYERGFKAWIFLERVGKIKVTA